jgi:hypothetical protein
MAALMSEVAFGKVLMIKVFKAPADCPNKRTFFYCGIVSMICKKGSGEWGRETYWVSSERGDI